MSSCVGVFVWCLVVLGSVWQCSVSLHQVVYGSVSLCQVVSGSVMFGVVILCLLVLDGA